MKLTTGVKLAFPSVGRLNFFYAYRPKALVDETTNATIAPGVTPTAQADPIKINGFRAAHAQAHEEALRKTAKQMGGYSCGKTT